MEMRLFVHHVSEHRLNEHAYYHTRCLRSFYFSFRPLQPSSRTSIVLLHLLRLCWRRKFAIE